MARASYLRHAARRAVGEMPILRPPRPLFRAWEASLVPDMPEEPLSGFSQPAARPIEPGSISVPPAARQSEKLAPDHFISITQPATKTTQPSVTTPRASLLPGRRASTRPAQLFAGQQALQEAQATSTDLKPGETASPAAPTINRLKPVPQASDEMAAQAIAAAVKSQQGQDAPLRPAPQRTPEAASGSTLLKRVPNGLLPTQAEPAFLLPRKPELSPPAPKAEQRQKASIHIGSIEVHITPTSPAVPPARTLTAQSQPTSSLSRGFTSPFGIRQG